MKTFLITGLPRSRTAWLANLFTTGHVYCQHDGLRKTPPDKWADTLKAPNRPVCGIADCMVPLMLPESRRAGLLQGPVIISWRDRAEVASAMSRAFGIEPEKLTPFLDKAEAGLLALTRECDVYHLRPEDFENEQAISAAWSFATEGLAFDAERWRELCRLNIQVQGDPFTGACDHWKRGEEPWHG